MRMCPVQMVVVVVFIEGTRPVRMPMRSVQTQGVDGWGPSNQVAM